MTGIRSKRPRLKLNAEAYRQLCREVLERDGWRCQSCGSIEGLEVHHIQPRSRLGDDTVENLVALCVMCHQKAHRQRQDMDGFAVAAASDERIKR
ncbi:MAG: HNH endonuclease [Candidatus Acidiferrales bacterium]